MSKRTKIVAVVVAVALALTVGLTTAVLAQEPPAEEGDVCKGPVQTFISKVATTLGVEEGQLIDAIEQTRQEMKDEAVECGLQRAIEKERITEQEANEIQEWLQNRPGVLQDFGHRARLHLGNAWCQMRPLCPYQ